MGTNFNGPKSAPPPEIARDLPYPGLGGLVGYPREVNGCPFVSNPKGETLKIISIEGQESCVLSVSTQRKA